MEVSFHQSSLGKSKSIPFLSCSTVNFKGKKVPVMSQSKFKKEIEFV